MNGSLELSSAFYLSEKHLIIANIPEKVNIFPEIIYFAVSLRITRIRSISSIPRAAVNS